MKKIMNFALSLIVLTCSVAGFASAAHAQSYTLVNWTGDESGDFAREEHELYEEATSALDERRWDHAIRLFDRVARMQGSRADGALYWKAWAEARSGRRPDATQTLATLKKTYPSSRWLGDAKALEIEIQKSSGGSASPDNYEDEELKLIALFGIIENDPDRGVAAVEKILSSSASLMMKERALYLLAETDSPKAAALLKSTARGQANPDLQLRAIRFLGVMEDKDSMAFLEEIYAASKDREVRIAVIEAWMEAEALPQLRNAAEKEPDKQLRAAAIHALGDAGDTTTLKKLYSTEQSKEVRYLILSALENSEDLESLEMIMKTEKDVQLRAEAIRRYGFASEEKGTAVLVSIYKQEKNEEIRAAVLDAMTGSDDATGLIELAKFEKDKQWRREIVSRLAHSDSKEAQAYLESLLN